jgi:hypothetical protein
VTFAEPLLQASSLGAAAAAQHGIGKSKLRHASSSPELANIQQQGHLSGGAAGPQHARSKLGGAASTAGELNGLDESSGSQGVNKEQMGGQRSTVSPEPKHGCAASWTSMLTQKLHNKSSKKHQQQAVAAVDAQEQQEQHGALAAIADQQQQQQLSADGAHASGPGKLQLQPQPPQQQQYAMSPVASSSGDSISELVHAGNCQELCVGQQGRGQVADGLMDDDLAMLTGQPLGKVAEEESRGALGG